MRPSVCRLVHYVSADQHAACQAAMITEVMPGSGTVTPETASLTVFHPDGFTFELDVRQDEAGHRGGTWHWPERTE